MSTSYSYGPGYATQEHSDTANSGISKAVQRVLFRGVRRREGVWGNSEGDISRYRAVAGNAAFFENAQMTLKFLRQADASAEGAPA